MVEREEGQTHATNNGSPFCTQYVAIFYTYCCSGSLASSLARSLHISLSAMRHMGVHMWLVCALLTFGRREDTAAVPCRNEGRKR